MGVKEVRGIAPDVTIIPVKVLADHGFEILATQGTAEVLRRNGVEATVVRKHFEGEGRVSAVVTGYVTGTPSGHSI